MTMVRSMYARLLSRGAAVGASLCLLALAPVADAAPTTPAAPGAKPSCVRVRHTAGTITQTVYVTNHCSRTVSFVVHRAGPDSPCLHAAPGSTRWYRWANGLNYEGTSFGCD